MDAWLGLSLPEDIMNALLTMGFKEPTPIQKRVLPDAILKHLDVLGAAPTHSIDDRKIESNPTDCIRPISSKKSSEGGDKDCLINNPFNNLSDLRKRKGNRLFCDLDMIEELDPDTGATRAIHSLPSVDQFLLQPSSKKDIINYKYCEKNDASGRVYGLVLLPTRELAIQVCKHLRAVAEHISSPQIRIEAIVGGLSIEKQIRLIKHRPDVIVATPGRLWQLVELVS
ncbi:unnamed protein product [Protopolystoma xenopodis]|uniref:ATP-dependent RNA helicase n=1 Tax=Protopolystoma xenopodis TaxID=117903 RepID=A0A448XDU7_9PLAT|nr:unnamed protein product [Protopolystoma xenopodis]